MPHSRIHLTIALPEEVDHDIRHARLETLKAIATDPHPALIAPMPHAVYLLAHIDGRKAPIGLAEAAFLEQHYGTYEEVPYSGVFDIPSLCPYPQLAGIRTVYTDPEFRFTHGLYLKLILGQAYIFRSLGALYSTATTNATNEGLTRLYGKTGGTKLGTFTHEAFRDPVALFLFELDALLRHPMTPRMLRDLDLDRSVLATVRARTTGSTLTH